MKDHTRTVILPICMLALMYQPLLAQHKDQQSNVSVPVPVTKAAELITATQLRDYLYYVASDELERDTPSRGLDAVANFIALNLSHWGLKPVGDNGTYFQRFGIIREKINRLRTFAELRGQRFAAGSDFLTIPVAGMAGTASGQLVYVGHGWVIKAKNINPYEGVDVKDKIVIFSHIGAGYPNGINASDLTGKRGEDWEIPRDAAMNRGAKGIIRIPTLDTLIDWNANRKAALEDGHLLVEQLKVQDAPRLPEITLSLPLMDILFDGEKYEAKEIFTRGMDNNQAESFQLKPGKVMTFTIGVETERLSTQNVVALIEGSDPVLKNEFVTINAHYDAKKEGPPVGGDVIHNGADDNGSGTVALLAMAGAFMHAPRPKRSIVFIWDSGEEVGNLGSRFFTENPIVPLSQIVTHINVDMIGRSKKEGDTNPRNRELTGPNEVNVIGPKTLSTDLLKLLESVNRAYLKLDYNYRYDAVNNPQFFPRSDHTAYLQKGILVLSYSTGLHEDYHGVSDSPEKIDYQKMGKITRTIFVSAWTIANQVNRLLIDKPLPAELRNRRLW